MSDFIYTTAINKLRKLKKRVRVIPGGTSAGKTYGIIPVLVDDAARNPGLEISIVSESIPHLRRGALRDFEKIMRASGRWQEGRFNKALLKYTFNNGSFIEFFSTDQPDRLRGARRNVLYINEANNVSFESYLELAVRTSKTIWLDFNPTGEFWVDTELANDKDVEILKLTYLDNEAAPEAAVKEIEKARQKAKTSDFWANWYKVYGLGERGILQGVVFSNWQTIPAIPSEAQLIGCGLDFGYTNDPSALIEVYNYNGKRILNERLYSTGMHNKDIATYLPKCTIWADSAEPKSIDEIFRLGHDIRGATKGRDSINFGIQVMQNQQYLVTQKSVNLIKELRSYCWDKDKTGTTLNKPVDKWNHAIDAIRYHEMETVGFSKELSFY